MHKNVTIIDYGMSNLLSITRAVEHVGGKVTVTDNPGRISGADYLILPGVGSFYDGMKELNSRDLPGAIHEFINTGKPFLGICLGMQMMLGKGTEVQECEGLNIISGTVLPLPEADRQGSRNRVPHVCWNNINYTGNGGSVFNEVPDNSYMYFVHSYYAAPDNAKHVHATTAFSDGTFAAVLNKDNAWGMQFHPEKSGETGLKILSNFINL